MSVYDIVFSPTGGTKKLLWSLRSIWMLCPQKASANRLEQEQS